MRWSKANRTKAPAGNRNGQVGVLVVDSSSVRVVMHSQCIRNVF